MPVMVIPQQAVRYGQRRLARRLTRSIPWLGAAFALMAVGSAVRRKGLFRGTFDSALNAIPFVGGLKNAMEIARGRDFIRDRDTSLNADHRTDS
jgi:hypothetical protein